MMRLALFLLSSLSPLPLLLGSPATAGFSGRHLQKGRANNAPSASLCRRTHVGLNRLGRRLQEKERRGCHLARTQNGIVWSSRGCDDDFEISAVRRRRMASQLAVVAGLGLGAGRGRSEEMPGTEATGQAQREFAAKVYFDISVNEGDPSRVVVGVYKDGLLGEERFLQLAEGAGAGLDYRRSLFSFISPDKSFVKNAGVGSITGYGSREITLAGGSSTRELQKELSGQTRSHTKPGIVSLIVRNKDPPPPNEKKLVAESGRLVTIEEKPKGYVEPNGSEFVLTTKSAPYLDESNLIVGEVLDGMDVIEKIAGLPTSKPKGNDDPFFKVGKSIGDSRALFMATRFGRPFARVQIIESGKLS